MADAGHDDGVAAPGLPDDAPEEVRLFVSCRSDTLELREGRMPWLPTPDHLPDPKVSVEPGEGPGSARVGLAWLGGLATLHLTASIEDGRLRIEAPRVPSLLGGGVIRRNIEGWVDDFNDALRRNGKQLGRAEVDGGRLTLTKVDAAS